jgi:hypothetical protein
MTSPSADHSLCDYHGPHPAPQQEQHERLVWRSPSRRTHRIRVVRHSCECEATIFELCQAGGLAFIRKSLRRTASTVVHETDWMPSKRASQLYERVLRGEAR